MFANKLTEKALHPHNAKEHYQPFIRKQNKNSVNQLKLITYQPKTFENLNIFDKSVITEHPKTFHKLSKTEKGQTIGSQVGSNSFLYSDTKNKNTF